MTLIERARDLATRSHAGQVDKAGLPYIDHCRRVAERVEEIVTETVGPGGDDVAIAAAWCHDVIEDTSVSTADLARELGSSVAALVATLTRQPHEPYHSYINRLAEPTPEPVRSSSPTSPTIPTPIAWHSCPI